MSFCQNKTLWHQTSSCKYSMCLLCVCKVSDGFSKSSGTSWFPHACTIWALTKPLLSNKLLKKMAMFKMLSFCQKVFLWHQTSSFKCSMCLHYACKVSDSFSKSSGTSWFPYACILKPLLRSKVSKKMLLFCQKTFYGIKLLHANVQCVYSLYAKYQTVSVKAVVGVEFLAHALSSTIQNF